MPGEGSVTLLSILGVAATACLRPILKQLTRKRPAVPEEEMHARTRSQQT